MSSKDSCACNWSECAQFHQRIQSLAPPAHPWKDPPARIRLEPTQTGEISLHVTSVFRAMLHYFDFEDKVLDDYCSNIYVRRHHFPLALFKWRRENNVKHFTKLLSREDINRIDFLEGGRPRFGERSNSVKVLCRDLIASGQLIPLGKQLQGFVQTPMETRSAVKLELACIESNKKKAATQEKNDHGSPLILSANHLSVSPDVSGTNPAPEDQPQFDTASCQDESRGTPFLGSGTPSPQLLQTPVGQSITMPHDDRAISVDKAGQPPIPGAWTTPPTELSSLRSRNLFGVLPIEESPEGGVCIRASPLPPSMDAYIRTILIPASASQSEASLKSVFAKFLPMCGIQCYLLTQNKCDDGGDSLRARLCTAFGEIPVVKTLAHLLLYRFHSCARFVLTEGIWYCPCPGVIVGKDIPDPTFDDNAFDQDDWCDDPNQEQALPNNCTYFTFRSRRWGTREVYCANCFQARLKRLRTIRRRTQAPTKCRPLKCLSLSALRRLCKERRRENDNIKRRLNRLLCTLKSEKECFRVPAGTPLHKFLSTAVEYVEKNLKVSQQELIRVLLELELGCNENDAEELIETKHQRDECIQHILESISNMGKHLRGQDSQMRYSPHVLNAALCLFMRSPKAYEELRSSGVVCFPSPRSMRTLASKSKSYEGGDPFLYVPLLNEIRLAGGSISGHLMMDEIKLRNGIAYNCNSNEVVGFVDKQLDLKETFRQMLQRDHRETLGTVLQETQEEATAESEEVGTESHETQMESEGTSKDDDDAEGKVVVFANQWRFRSTRGVVHNGDFYFNNGSLNGNELLRQFISVLKSYEFIGCLVLGLVSDAGGGNASLFKILRNHESITGPWPLDSSISFPNPVCPSRKVYVWTCSTHGLKASRNSLLHSQPEESRAFIRSGVMFGWREIIDCWLRDEFRRTLNASRPRSDLLEQAVYLDNYSVMNCRYAKLPFSERTICEMIRFAAETIEVDIDWTTTHNSQWHKFHSICEVLKTASNERVNVTDDTRAVVYALEFQIAMHGIFIERFMNKFWKLNRANIAQEKQTLQEILAYFESWRDERTELEERLNITDRRESARHYQAAVTYENLLLTVAGFVGYAENVLLHDPDVDAYVPALHSNQSSIESLFSRLRALGRDRVDQYAGGISQLNTMNTINGLRKKTKEDQRGNVCYPEEDIGDEHQAVNEGDFHALLKKQEIIVADLVNVRQELRGRHPVEAGPGVAVVPDNFMDEGSVFGFLLRPFFSRVHLPKETPHFQSYLMEDKMFSGFFVLSKCSQRHESWFERFLDKEMEMTVDNLCRDIVQTLIHFMEHSLEARQKTSESSFEYLVQHFMGSGELFRVVSGHDDLLGRIRDRVCAVVLVDVLKDFLCHSWLFSAIHLYRNRNEENAEDTLQTDAEVEETSELPSATNETTDENVNRLAGWALSEVLGNYRDRRETEIIASGEDIADQGALEGHSKCSDIVSMLEDMKVLKEDIWGDSRYIQRYYPLDDAVRDKGFLTLIAPAFIEDFSVVSRYITKNLTLRKVKKHSRDGRIKTELREEMEKDEMTCALDRIVQESEHRLPNLSLSAEDRHKVLAKMTEKMSNAAIGSIVRRYRSEKLTSSANGVTFRKSIAALTERRK